MSEYVPSPKVWVADQVELYESSGGTLGVTLRDTGLPVIIVTTKGNKTGAIRKVPLLRVMDGKNYVLIGSHGGNPANPVWYFNLKVNPRIEIRDQTDVYLMVTREILDPLERSRLWDIAIPIYPRFEDYRRMMDGVRVIPMFIAEQSV